MKPSTSRQLLNAIAAAPTTAQKNYIVCIKINGETFRGAPTTYRLACAEVKMRKELGGLAYFEKVKGL